MSKDKTNKKRLESCYKQKSQKSSTIGGQVRWIVSDVMDITGPPASSFSICFFMRYEGGSAHKPDSQKYGELKESYEMRHGPTSHSRRLQLMTTGFFS